MNKLLIVEDIVPSARFLAGVAERVFGTIDIRIAANLGAARQLLDGFRPQLMLLDLGLPDGSGLSLMSLPAVRQCRVVVTTIFDDDYHLFEALRQGAQGYLLKDDSADHMAAALARIEQGHPPLSASIAYRILGSFRAAPSETAEPMTPREQQVLALIAKGHTNREVALALALTPNTVASYIKSIYQKLHISSRAEAATHAFRMGLS